MKKSEIIKILNDKKITCCYIWKNGWYYRPSSKGYTESKLKAGIFTKEEAATHCNSCDEIKMIPINNSEHNNLLLSEITDLLTRIIN